eukprot:scaffold35964_cov50-Phaeocystis_antarctica.AAC.4
MSNWVRHSHRRLRGHLTCGKRAGVGGLAKAARQWAAWPNMPSGQSEEYHIVTVQSDQARVGFSSSGKHSVCEARGAAVAGGRGRRRTSRVTRLHESTSMTSMSTSLHLPPAACRGWCGR